MIAAFKKKLKISRMASSHKEEYKNHWLWSSRIPGNYTVQDIFLVSYPKSGSTYLRFLISNAIKLFYNINREVNFFTLQDTVPWISEQNLSPHGPFGRTDLPRIIKSHYAYNPHYRRTILLVRDPRDVLISHYFYLKGLGKIPDNWTISEFIRNEEYSPTVWARHTESWYFGLQNLEKNVQIFKYEDFLSEPKETLDRLMNLIGIQLQLEDLEEAIRLSSKDNMKKLEVATMPTRLIKNQEIPFVRQGKATKGEKLSLEDKEFIEEGTRDIAKIVGYSY